MNQKVLVIGIDGGSLNILKNLADKGVMPNFAKMLYGGVFGELKSTYPPISPSAWASFMTGKNPGKHGITWFLRKVPREYIWETISSKSIPQKTLWQYLSENGKKVVVINVPMTYPPQSVNGVMISGMGTPDEKHNFTYPKEIKSELEQKVGGYTIDISWVPRTRALKKEAGLKKFIADLNAMTKERSKATLHYLKKIGWDFAMVVFVGADRIQHTLWEYLDTQNLELASKKNWEIFNEMIMGYFKNLDLAIGKIIEAAGQNSNVIVLSDHGFGSLHKKIDLNILLANWGLLSFKSGLRNKAIFRSLVANYLGTERMERIAALGREVVSRIKKNQSRRQVNFIDWGVTKAFSSSLNGIYINLKGRESLGTVEPGKEYEKIRDFIIEKLSQFKDPETEKKVISEVKRKEEVYTGEYLEILPDLIITDHEEGYMLAPTARSFREPLIEVTRIRSGDHRLQGIIVVRGKDIQKGKQVKGAEIIDVFPTILHLMDIDIPAGVDGKILPFILKDEDLKTPAATVSEQKEGESKISQAEKLSPEENRKILENLRRLGYLD